MIIRFPTALYARQLPQGTEAGNITWVISTEDPKTSNARFLKLPLAEELRKRPGDIFDESTRRAHEGELVFTLLRGDQSMAASGQKQFGIGQVLDFENNGVAAATSLAPDPTPSTVEIQHNNNLFDYAGIGLSDEDVAILTQQATTKKRELEDELTSLKSQIHDVSLQISGNQAKINETQKVIDATRQLYGIEAGDTTFNNALYQKLLGIMNNFLVQRDDLTTQYQTLTTEAQTVYNSLLQLSDLVH
jgi:hypothetical protein